MADLFAPITGEVCYVSVEDVRDTLGGVFLATAVPLITDAEIELLIIEAQVQVNSYLNGINPDIPCSGIVDTETEETTSSCGQTCGCKTDSNMVATCEDVPLNIKRATMQLVDNVYTDQQTGIVASITGSTLNPGDIIREKTACGVEIEYYAGDGSNDSGDDLSPCILVDCKTERLLQCYEKRTGKMKLCKTPCCNIKICNNGY